MKVLWAAIEYECSAYPLFICMEDFLGRLEDSSCAWRLRGCGGGWQGECTANWEYMVGGDDQKALKGYCRFSCGACSPSAASGAAPLPG